VAELWIAFCDGSDTVADDTLPTEFPWTDASMSHTFSLDDGAAPLLIQLDSIWQE
jgi:hypothetical protein